LQAFARDGVESMERRIDLEPFASEHRRLGEAQPDYRNFVKRRWRARGFSFDSLQLWFKRPESVIRESLLALHLHCSVRQAGVAPRELAGFKRPNADAQSTQDDKRAGEGDGERGTRRHC
jgi:hypothetical protein